MVTGANGWLGSALCVHMAQLGHQVLPAVRRAGDATQWSVGEVNGQTHWDHVLSQEVDAVVHLAAKLPTRGAAADERVQELAYASINTQGTLQLAQACAKYGVKRFVFVSTVKVLGEGRPVPYGAHEQARPQDAYARSKWQAEQGLWQLAQGTPMEVVVLRPPLVYGPGVRGNFFDLMQLVDRHIPFPFACVQNRRSLVYLDNLVELLALCTHQPNVAGQTLHISDGEDVSTPELLRHLAKAMGRRLFLLPVPVALLRLLGHLLNRAAADRLVGSLAVDAKPLRQLLAWQPTTSLQAGMAATARWYLKRKVES